MRKPVFLRSTSPGNTYAVNLKGDKRRAFVIPNFVSADVFKLNQPFVSDIPLHTAHDSFDLSFESGFPEVRWSGDAAIEFYRPDYFEWGAKSLIVSNQAGKSIKYLHVASENKFLLFDVQPGQSLSLEIPAARGDRQYISLHGTFVDGTQIPFNSENFLQWSRKERSVYLVLINDQGSIMRLKTDSGIKPTRTQLISP